MDLSALMAILWSRRKWIIASVVVCGTVFGIVAFTTTPVYRATVVMVPASNDQGPLSGDGLGGALGQFGGLAALAGLNLNAGGSAPEESLAVLRSRNFTENFIRDRELAPVLFAERRNGLMARLFGSKEPTLSDAYRYFDKRVRLITTDRNTGLISLNIEWTNRDDAATWANALVSQLNAEMRRRALAKSAASMEYLQKALATTIVIDTREAIGRLMEDQINQGMFANVTEEYAFRVIDTAMTPDLKDKVRPKKALLLLLGVGLGGFFSSMAALLVPRRERAKPSR